MWEAARVAQRLRACSAEGALRLSRARACAGNHVRAEGAIELDHNLSLWGACAPARAALLPSKRALVSHRFLSQGLPARAPR